MEKEYIVNFIDWIAHKSEKINLAMTLMEYRAEHILSKENLYEDLYIDPEVDIVNSHPQVIQQVEKELYEFLELLLNNDVKHILQIGLGHFAATHFVLSLLMDSICTIEYDD